MSWYKLARFHNGKGFQWNRPCCVSKYNFLYDFKKYYLDKIIEYMIVSQMALSRVLDIYKRVASLRGQAPVKQLNNTLGKENNSKPNGTGCSRYTAANRARFSVVGIFELFSFLQQVFDFSCVFTRRLWRRSFFAFSHHKLVLFYYTDVLVSIYS